MNGNRTLGWASSSALLLASGIGALPAPAQNADFPLAVTHVSADEVWLVPRIEDVAALRSSEVTRLCRVPLPGGVACDLDVRRVELGSRRFGLQVDGVAQPDLLAGLDLSVWMGSVADQPGSDAALSFSRYGCRGWIRLGGELFHIVAEPDPVAGWSASRARILSEATLLARGAQLPPPCESEQLGENSNAPVPAPDEEPLGGSQRAAPPLYECRVSVETDWQLNQVFGGNLAAESAYVASLLAWVSYRYEEQIQTVLTYPYVQFYTTPNDPWSTPDNGGSSSAMLNEFRAAWMNNVPAGGHLGCFLSGAALGGGVAWKPGVCVPTYNFSVCGNIDGGAQFPPQQQGGNWDFMVMAHEIGHNFNAPHTHAYCPTPADQCAPQGYFGTCQTQQICTTQGTIMSYCHLCPGGTANITNYFHPWSVSAMRSWASTHCLTLYCADPVTYCSAKTNSLGCVPAIDYAGHPTLSGPDDFHVTASNVINNKTGLLFWGHAAASAPFQGGTKCVANPTVRTPQTSSGGNPGPEDCSGHYDVHLSHAYAAAHGMSAGTTIYAQFWSRDPLSPSTTGLTNALQFVVCQ